MKILTFNAAIQNVRILGRPVYQPVPFVEDRLQQLAPALRQLDADVVCLQELFHRDYQDYLYTRLQKRYPYASGFSNRGMKIRLGSELLVLSKFPLGHSNHHAFKAGPFEERWFTQKGFMHTQLQHPVAGRIHIINVHTTAGGHNLDPEAAATRRIRAAQILQLLEYSAQLERVFVIGDLNAGPESSPENYRQLLQAGFVDLFAHAKRNNVTWHPENQLVAHGPHAHLAPQRIDHIFIDRFLSRHCIVHDVATTFRDQSVSTRQGTRHLSDHYCVHAVLELQAPGTKTQKKPPA